VRSLEKNSIWFLTIGVTALFGLAIVWGAFTLTFLQPFGENLKPLEPLDPANYGVDIVEFLQPLDVNIVKIAFHENELIEQWREELWDDRISRLPGNEPTLTANPANSPSPTPLLTELLKSETPTGTPLKTAIKPPSSTPVSDTPTFSPSETSTITSTPMPTLVPTNTFAPTSPPRPTKPPDPTIVFKPPTITPSPVPNQTNTPKFGS